MATETTTPPAAAATTTTTLPTVGRFSQQNEGHCIARCSYRTAQGPTRCSCVLKMHKALI
ncbi:hypothetical protein E2C01_031647 [Portunus trituberculatus]|uniref:Uncharacterized protein n=1 Tax=Portunus trituberculatus TaxID=210409 RepID=A0A5B7EZ53_PORTR|nr:hypothetical protein [Portunus trituberculatus]